MADTVLTAETHKALQKAACWCEGCSHRPATDIITLWKVKITKAPFIDGCIYALKHLSRVSLSDFHISFRRWRFLDPSALDSLNNLVVIWSIHHTGRGQTGSEISWVQLRWRQQPLRWVWVGFWSVCLFTLKLWSSLCNHAALCCCHGVDIWHSAAAPTWFRWHSHIWIKHTHTHTHTHTV